MLIPSKSMKSIIVYVYSFMNYFYGLKQLFSTATINVASIVLTYIKTITLKYNVSKRF